MNKLIYRERHDSLVTIFHTCNLRPELYSRPFLIWELSRTYLYFLLYSNTYRISLVRLLLEKSQGTLERIQNQEIWYHFYSYDL